MKKINNTFQHKFSILHGSIVDNLLKLSTMKLCFNYDSWDIDNDLNTYQSCKQ